MAMPSLATLKVNMLKTKVNPKIKPLNIRTPIPQAAIAVFPMPITIENKPVAALKAKMPSTAIPTHFVMFGNSCVQPVKTDKPPIMVCNKSFMVGIKALPKPMRTASVTDLNCSHGSTMALAIISAFFIPLIFPRAFMLSAKPSVLPIN